MTFDFHDHALIGETADMGESFPLEAMCVADFLSRTTTLVERLGGRMDIHGAPNEIPDAKPFARDTALRPYDRKAVERFHRALVQIDRVFARFRTGYLGKVSPVHLFWGSFDLAVTRFSGRKAPLHPGGVPALPDSILRRFRFEDISALWRLAEQGIRAATSRWQRNHGTAAADPEDVPDLRQADGHAR